MRTKFRGITEREIMIFEGPEGWGEWGPFLEYENEEATLWLQSALEAAFLPAPRQLRNSIEINGTIPRVSPAELPAVVDRFPGVGCFKLKVGLDGPGADQRSLDSNGVGANDDIVRLEALATMRPDARFRLDANGTWSPAEAMAFVAQLAERGFDLARIEYLEQPCAQLAELIELRELFEAAGIELKIAADESVRRASDPLLVASSGAADILVLKAAPLGGVRSGLRIAAAAGLPVVVSSALESSVGMVQGLRLAACLPSLDYACGLGTVALLEGDVAEQSLVAENGRITSSDAGFEVRVNRDSIDRYRARPEREAWWQKRLAACFEPALAGLQA